MYFNPKTNIVGHRYGYHIADTSYLHSIHNRLETRDGVEMIGNYLQVTSWSESLFNDNGKYYEFIIFKIKKSTLIT
jgi:hypothetical protein